VVASKKDGRNVPGGREELGITTDSSHIPGLNPVSRITSNPVSTTLSLVPVGRPATRDYHEQQTQSKQDNWLRIYEDLRKFCSS